MKKEQTEMPNATKRPVLFVAAVTSIVTFVTLLAGAIFVVVPTAATTPGSPGTAQAGTPIYSETFSNQTATAPIALHNYTGSAGTTGADSETYNATGGYTTASNQCDGWILNSTTSREQSDSGCTTAAWVHLRALADILGQAQGQSATQAASNQALSEYTNGSPVNPGTGYDLESNANAIPAVAGHFYTVSAYFAEENCGSSHAQEDFYLDEDGTPVEVGTNLDPCSDADAKTYTDTIGGTVVDASVSQLISSALKTPDTGAATLGLQLFDAQKSGLGNDAAFDLPQIVDVTPQLDKAFSPTTIAKGGTSTLTYTITNTSELDAKDGWAFLDDLPTDVTATGVNSTTCSTGTIAAAAGSSTVSVTNGDLIQGQASCTVSVQVTSSVIGTYTNSATNFPATGGLNGLNAPGSTTLEVDPTVNLAINKTSNVTTYTAGQKITYTVTVTNAGPETAMKASVSDPLPTSITDATWTCTASSGATCTASGSGSINDSVTIPANGSLVYKVTGTVASGTTGNVVNTATVVPPAGTLDSNCPPSPGVGCSHTVTTPSSTSPTATTTMAPTTTSTTAPKTVQPISVFTGHPASASIPNRTLELAGLGIAAAGLATMVLLIGIRRRRDLPSTRK